MRHNEFGQPIGDALTWTGAQPATPVTMVGRTCRLEPLRPDHVADLYAACTAYPLRAADPQARAAWTYLFFEPPDDRAGMQRVVAELIESPTFVPFAICLPDGTAVGTASYLRIDPTGGTIEVGSVLYGAPLRRTTAATEAMWLMARQVFDEWGYRRYEWKCDALNAPSRVAARRLGFREEGTWRQAVVTKGRNRDTTWFAMTDTDWPRIDAAMREWLDPANIGPDGLQRAPLAAAPPD